MSYEGFEQHICANGHRFDTPCDTEEVCNVCSAKSVWFNSVDDTNFESFGIIPKEDWNTRFKISDAVEEVCNLGHKHITKEATYRVPTDDESIDAQCFWDGYQFVQLTKTKVTEKSYSDN